LAFDMLDPVILEADEFVEMNQRIAAAGEHMVGFVPAAEYEALLAGCGLSADVWDADRICRRYVGDSWQGGFPGTYVVLARPA
jgi:hypothetical protein